MGITKVINQLMWSTTRHQAKHFPGAAALQALGIRESHREQQNTERQMGR